MIRRTGGKLEEGFGLLAGLTVAAIFSALLLAMISIPEGGSPGFDDKSSRLEAEKQLSFTGSMILTELSGPVESDYYETADSPHLHVFDLIKKLETEEEIQISLSDISSRVNLNTFRDEIIIGGNGGRAGGLSYHLFAVTESMSLIEADRANSGFFLHLKDLDARLPGMMKKDSGKYLTFHGYWNINISDEKSLEQIYEDLTGDPIASEMFRERIREKRINLETAENNETDILYGEHAELVYPFISSVPLMNVNFIPGEILYGILAHDFGSRPLPDPEESYNRITAERNYRPIKPGELPEILGIEDTGHPIYDYLGTRTWFWELEIAGPDAGLTIRAAVIPDRNRSYKPGNPVLADIGSASINPSSPGELIRIIENRFEYREKMK